MALPSINDLKMWVGTLFTKDDWDYNFSQIVSWFAGGNSDIVVNSVKATNGIDLDGSQLSNLGPATTGAQAVTLDQATTLLNRTSYYYPFSIASGKVDSNGNAAFLQKDSDTQVTVLAGNVNPDLVCIQSDGTIESVTSNTILTIPATDGVYHVIKEKGQAITNTTGSSGKVIIGKKFPSSLNIGDYFLDNSGLPFKGYKYTSSGWAETPFCFLGNIIVSGGFLSIDNFPYNYNWYDVNFNNQGVMFRAYRYGTSGYVMYTNGYCEQWGDGSNGWTTAYFIIPFVDTNYNIQLTTYQDGNFRNHNTGLSGLYADRVAYYSELGIKWRASGYVDVESIRGY